MKKVIIVVLILILLIIAFCASIFYTSSFNERIFNSISKGNTLYYDTEDINFTKGFLQSKGSFKLIPKDIQIAFDVDVEFNNNFFSKNNATAFIYNEELKKYTPDGKIAQIFFNFGLNGNKNIKFELNDLNISDNSTNLQTKNAYISVKGGEFIEKIEANMDYFTFEEPEGKMEINNLKISQIPIVKIDFNENLNLASLHESDQNISVQSFFIRPFLGIDNINTQATTKINEQNNYDSTFKANIDKFNLKELEQKDIAIDNIKLDMDFKNISKTAYDKFLQNSDTNILYTMSLVGQFLKANPKIILNDFSFQKDGIDVNATAQIAFEENNTKANALIKSKELPSKISDNLKQFDGFFVDDNGSYTLNFIYDDSDKNNVKNFINGKNYTLQ